MLGRNDVCHVHQLSVGLACQHVQISIVIPEYFTKTLYKFMYAEKSTVIKMNEEFGNIMVQHNYINNIL